jgi:hypothetical protein
MILLTSAVFISASLAGPFTRRKGRKAPPQEAIDRTYGPHPPAAAKQSGRWKCPAGR